MRLHLSRVKHRGWATFRCFAPAIVGLALGLAGCKGCEEGGLEPVTSTLDWSPKVVVFEKTWVGGVRGAEAAVRNTGRAPAHASLRVDAPFEVESPEVDVAGGSTVVVTLRFRPTQAGSYEVPLLGATGVTLRAESGEALDCGVQPCRLLAFDPLDGRCTETVAADGEPCQAPYACFADAQCRQGRCVGSRPTCDDTNLCTTDVCGETGCVHLDATFDCPWPADPCQAPACTPGVGCGTAPMPDGTECGARDCRSAHVCVNGACLQRAAPQTQGCTELVYGEPNSCAAVDGTGPNARVGGGGLYDSGGLVVAADGTVYFTDGACVRAVTGRTARTLAGQCDSPGHVDGVGANARFESPNDLELDAAGLLLVADHHTIRRMTRGGLLGTLAGSPGPVFERRDGVGANARFTHIAGLTRAPDGTLFVTDGYGDPLPDGGQMLRSAIRRVTPYGEVSTIWTAPSNDLRVNDVIWVDGGLVGVGYVDAAWSGLFRPEADGGATQLAPSCLDRGVARSDGVLCNWLDELHQTHADGGFEVLATFSSYVRRGPWAVAAGPDGTAWALAYTGGCGLWHMEDGGAHSVIGSSVQAQETGAPDPVRLIQGPTGSPWFQSNQEYNVLYEVLADGGAGAAAHASAGIVGLASRGGHVFSLDSSGQVSDLVAEPDGGRPFCACPIPSNLSGLAVLGQLAVCADSTTGLSVCSADGGSQLVFASDTTLVDGPPGVGTLRDLTFARLAVEEDGGLLLANANRLRAIDASWTVSTVAQLDGGGLGAVAPLGQTSYVLAFYGRRQTIVAWDGTQFQTVAQLADPIRDMAGEDGGTLLVSVPGAIFRVRP